MRKLAVASFILALVSVAMGIISRLLYTPLPIAPYGIEAEACLIFTNTCLLISITALFFFKVKKG